MQRHAGRAVIVVGLLLLATATIICQHALTKLEGPVWKKESMAYLPGSERIKPLFLGFEATYAHFLWIRTVIYFGDHYATDKDYTWLIRMLDIITRLDPHFFPAYEFAGLIVPTVFNNPEPSLVILERGMTAIGSVKWNIPFYIGILYLKFYNDKETAARYFSLAARVPGAPIKNLARTTAAYFNQIGRKQEAISFLQVLYTSSENDGVRKYLYSKMMEMQK